LRAGGDVSWRVADVAALPLSDREFSIVVLRFAFHHLETPRAEG
jgi:ubiquinone/menaquinone biosynthesis C-methylase UbiE